MKEGDSIQIDIVRITNEGKGVGFLNDGKIVLIDGIEEGDGTVNVRIKRIFEETVLAEKVSRLNTGKAARKDLVDSPYEMDEGDNEDEENT